MLPSVRSAGGHIRASWRCIVSQNILMCLQSSIYDALHEAPGGKVRRMRAQSKMTSLEPSCCAAWWAGGRRIAGGTEERIRTMNRLTIRHPPLNMCIMDWNILLHFGYTARSGYSYHRNLGLPNRRTFRIVPGFDSSPLERSSLLT